MGDRERLIVAEIPRLRRYARALTGDPNAADDLVQDCLERAWGRFHLWRRGSNLRAWMFTIMHNVHANAVRSAKARPRTFPLEEARLATRPRQDDAVAVRGLARALAQLPLEQRQVILLVGLEEMELRRGRSGGGCPHRNRHVAPVARPRSVAGPDERGGAVSGGEDEMTDHTRVSEDELHAFLDDRIDVARRPAVEAYLAANPEEAARIAAYAAHKEALHGLYDPVLDEPLPEAMVAVRRRRTPAVAVLRAAAALALLVVGGVAGWWLHDALPQDAAATAGFVRQATIAHAVYTPEVRHPVEVTADEEAHLVKWLSKRLGAPLEAPSLREIGYSLVGGRLLPASEGPAALFMYESERGERMTLYVQSPGKDVPETAFRYEHEGGIGVFYWIDRPLSYAISGEMDRPSLLRLAEAVYDRLEMP